MGPEKAMPPARGHRPKPDLTVVEEAAAPYEQEAPSYTKGQAISELFLTRKTRFHH